MILTRFMDIINKIDKGGLQPLDDYGNDDRDVCLGQLRANKTLNEN